MLSILAWRRDDPHRQDVGIAYGKERDRRGDEIECTVEGFRQEAEGPGNDGCGELG